MDNKSAPVADPIQGPWDHYRFANRQRTWLSWFSSLLFHVFAVAIIAFLLYQIPKGMGQEQVATGGIVLVNADLDANEKPYLEQDDIENQQQAEEAAAAAAAAGAVAATEQPLALDELPDLPGMNTSQDAVSQAIAAQQAMPGSGDLAVPTAETGGGKIGQSPVKFSGVSGSGSRFVYVVDRSASMNNEGLMRSAKAELEASLKSLTEAQQFQVIFYNDESVMFNPTGGPPKLHYGLPANIQAALAFVKQTQPVGGTAHVDPIKQALDIGADVIFLLTDADDGLTSKDLLEIQRANRAAASINVIVFGPTAEPTAANLSFQKLTRDTRGQFSYKSLSQLRRNR